MHRILFVLSAAVAMIGTSLAAQDRQSQIEATLNALPDLPLLTSEACLENVSLLTAPLLTLDATDGVSGAPYTRPYDQAAAERSSEIANTVLAANDATRAYETTEHAMSAELFLGVRGFVTSVGVNPDHIVDMAAYYLVVVATLDPYNYSLDPDAETIAALREQIALGEADCGQIAAALEENPDLASAIMVHLFFFLRTFEDVAANTELSPALAVIQDRFRSQLAGREMSFRNGLQ